MGREGGTRAGMIRSSLSVAVGRHNALSSVYLSECEETCLGARTNQNLIFFRRQEESTLPWTWLVLHSVVRLPFLSGLYIC